MPPESVLPVAVSPEQRAQLERFLQLLLEANTRFNLTAVREHDVAWERHVVESLRLVPLLGDPRTLLDVGSGGGLPGLVLAIARPDTTVTLLESSAKKAQFLADTSEALGLTNVHVDCRRAESAAAPGEPLRESFDVVTARAVAALPVLLELTVPFVRLGGRVLAVKGERASEELAAAQRAQHTLHVELETSERQPSATVLIFVKRGTTPVHFPRRPGEPSRKPL
ncbi:MAG: 16S rRNA (guanine(527)-N(7))-methyltransferase RsmG [Polyangiales bacterium]